MSRRKVFLYVAFSLIVVAVLVAGGYALYRLGYAHGIEGTRASTLDRHGMLDFNRKLVPDHWYSRDYIGFPFAFAISRLFSILIFVAFVALAVYGGIRLFSPDARDRKKVLESQTPQSESPVEGSPPAE